MLPEDERLNSMMGLGEPMEQFIHRYVNSFVKWEIVQYYHDHPDAPFKVDELSHNLNRPADQLRRELEELSTAGLLVKLKTGKQAAYVYSLVSGEAKDQELHETLEQFQALCRTREGRLRVIYKILKDGKEIGE
jgi:hypothetical protein